MNKTIFDQEADVEVLFKFNGTRKNPAADGYRPDHLVTDNYLTTGIHHYYDVQVVPPDGTAKGTITFLSPEAYPNCFYGSANGLIFKKVPVLWDTLQY